MLRRILIGVALALVMAGARPATAQIPGEVQGVTLSPSGLSWNAEAVAEDYNVYRGTLGDLAAGIPPRCHGNEIVGTSFASPADPPPGEGFVYLVTGEAAGGEGSVGPAAEGDERPLMGHCDAVTRNHVAGRIGYGWDEWTRDRIAALGIQGYIDEQLDPASIDEAGNTLLTDRLAVVDPPATIANLQAIDLLRAVYGRRQLDQRITLFWDNHFNTDYTESFKFFRPYRDDVARRRIEAVALHDRARESFRARALTGTFRQILDDSVFSPAMIIFLDTDNNIAGAPNENYARELLELHTMGVDGGYTHHEIDAMARVMTGWSVCKKVDSNVDEPSSACIDSSLIGTVDEPDGQWVTTFHPEQHDCGEKILFQGTPYEITIRDTCDSIGDGEQDVRDALDAIAAHPSTAAFVSRKLLREFVTDEPTQQMVDDVVAAWNDPLNPLGVGDLGAVLRVVLAQPEFLDPDGFGSKIRTPFEHAVAAFRVVRGKTNGSTFVRNYLKRMQHLLHQNPTPTGYAETGDEWIDTNGVLERQNLGMDLATRTGVNFGTDLIVLLQDHGVPVSNGHAAEVVDFFLDAMYGGAQAPAQRQQAIDYLQTDDDGVLSPSTWARIRETAGFLLGCPEFMAQ